jgi:SprT protein
MKLSQEAKDKHLNILRNYLPEEFVQSVFDLLMAFPLEFSIVRPRKTKLGDFRMGSGISKAKITVNGNLNVYQFLITTVHEVAHFYAFREYGVMIKAHGKEWQTAYRKVSLPFINSGLLPKDVEDAWQNSLVSVKASTCADVDLYRVLRNYSKQVEGLVLLENIANNGLFSFAGERFRRHEIRRKRYLCTKLKNGRKYLISALAEVEPII